jgi:hypothetical protein
VTARRLEINNLKAQIGAEEKETAAINRRLEIETETGEFLTKKIANSIEESRKEHDRLQAQILTRTGEVDALAEKLNATVEV